MAPSFADIKPLPAVVGTNIPAMPERYVRIHPGDAWSNTPTDLTLYDNVSNTRHLFYRDSSGNANNVVGRIAFNLPVGVVVTLCELSVEDTPGVPFDSLASCGRTIDLIGTGKPETVQVIPRAGYSNYNFGNRTFLSWFWREVDISMGALELYYKESCDVTDNRVVLFLSEWERDTVHSLSAWWFAQHGVKSVRWAALDGRQQVSLFPTTNGTLREFGNIAGYLPEDHIDRLADANFTRHVLAFRWSGIAPVKEVVHPVTYMASLAQQDTFVNKKSGVNKGANAAEARLTLTKKDVRTLTVTSTGPGSRIRRKRP